VGAERTEPMVEHARRLRVAAAVGGEAKGDLFKQVYCCVNRVARLYQAEGSGVWLAQRAVRAARSRRRERPQLAAEQGAAGGKGKGGRSPIPAQIRSG
jgi:hypothetical protein